MYTVGQTINIGLYDGFHNQDLLKRKAEITRISEATGLIWIKIYEPNGAYREMFGYEKDLKDMENNY